HAVDGATPDHLFGSKRLHEIYTRADPSYSGRVTVPVLWDKQQNTIVSNESSEIIRMLNTAFDAFGDASQDFYPEALRGEIDAVNALVYPNINN
ncbi:glutathione S-transferase family protein, partial [Escherichia coli]|nr:glutathione S-transferase family protein [Escherichia coli]